MSAYHKADYRVRISDADATGLMKYSSLFQFLQEIATEHAKILGIDFAKLSPMGLSWAITKMIVEIDRLPHWGERVYLTTWTTERERLATSREFVAVDASGKPLFRARNRWVVFDIKKRRLSHLDILPDWPRDTSAHAFNADFDAPMLKAESPSSVIPCVARNDDIDLNGHVNNSVYVSWAVESVAPEFLAQHTAKRIYVAFLGEVAPHAHVQAVCQQDGNSTYHAIENPADALHPVRARLNIDWRELQTPNQ